jgi:sialidase-1
MLALSSANAMEGFEDANTGGFTSLKTEYGTLTAEDGHAGIENKAKSGSHSLRLMGGDNKRVELKLDTPPKADVSLSAWAERWTGRDPFNFTITAITPNGEQQIYDGSKEIKTGGFNTKVSAQVPKDTQALRFESSTPDNSGVMLDDLYIVPSIPMTIEKVTTHVPVIPAMIRRDFNPVLRLDVTTEGCLNPAKLKSIVLDFTGTTNLNDIEGVEIVRAGEKPGNDANYKMGEPATTFKKNRITVEGDMDLESGVNYLWVNVLLKDNANIDGKIAVRALGVKTADKKFKAEESATATQRIGYTLAKPGDTVKTTGRTSKAFRIPGMVRSNKGTLIAVYDIRHNHAGDLPADIDIGVRRSTDGGQTWSDLEHALSCKKLRPDGDKDGVGDPAVLVDRKTGRIWVSGVWSTGMHPIWNSETGTTDPMKCGQFVLAYSDDDGKTWSDPINITKQVKSVETGTDSDWGALFQGPGNGICLKDGTLVFPAQYWAVDKVDGNEHRRGHSTLIYSKDHGKTWHCGTGIKENTSEAQVIELKDGGIMINARDESRSGYRVVFTTKDLGKTWTKHETSQNKETGLMEPGACQASIERIENEGPVKYAYFFSNPASHSGRNHMTLKMSTDDGTSWPEQYSTLYDERDGAGYSAIAPVDAKHIGVIYEGSNGYIYFLRFPYSDLIQK